MKRKTKYIQMIALPAIIMLCLNGCNIEVKVTHEGNFTNESVQAVNEDTTYYVTTNSTGKQTTTEKATENNLNKYVPETKEEMIDAYNQALEKSELSCLSSSQKVTQGRAWLGDKSDEYMDLLADDMKDLLAKFQQDNVVNTALTMLSADNVAVASVEENTITFNLNSASINETINQGSNGYIALIDDARVQELVEVVKDAANVSGKVKIISATHNLSDGTFFVTFNSNFTKIESVKYSANQNINAKMKYLVFNINIDIDYQLSAEFE